MEEKRDIICVCCPLGCSVTVTLCDGQAVKAEGNGCARGDTYAKEECVGPRRVFTSSARLQDGRMLSVKTAEAVPKDKIFLCAAALREITVTAPVRIGDVIIENIAESGVNLIATRNIS